MMEIGKMGNGNCFAILNTFEKKELKKKKISLLKYFEP